MVREIAAWTFFRFPCDPSSFDNINEVHASASIDGATFFGSLNIAEKDVGDVGSISNDSKDMGLDAEESHSLVPLFNRLWVFQVGGVENLAVKVFGRVRGLMGTRQECRMACEEE